MARRPGDQQAGMADEGLAQIALEITGGGTASCRHLVASGPPSNRCRVTALGRTASGFGRLTSTITTKSGYIGHSAKMCPPFVPFGGSGRLCHAVFSAGFIAVTFGSRFSASTGRALHSVRPLTAAKTVGRPVSGPDPVLCNRSPPSRSASSVLRPEPASGRDCGPWR
jgi:hypothetical protein